jgi:hypothetical protein
MISVDGSAPSVFLVSLEVVAIAIFTLFCVMGWIGFLVAGLSPFVLAYVFWRSLRIPSAPVRFIVWR